ncbi:WD40 repeat domain-containing protein, partial [Streptomyces fradiae]|uniref:WD40 repeat domain-containing protein n=1 Tax=Streptomyces fradiae TaxID=1906 RepID=UPI0035212FE6
MFFPGHADQVNSVAFSPDGKILATGGDEAAVRLWSMKAGRPLAIFAGRGDDAGRSVAFSPDGKTMAAASDERTVRVWDVG